MKRKKKKPQYERLMQKNKYFLHAINYIRIHIVYGIMVSMNYFL